MSLVFIAVAKGIALFGVLLFGLVIGAKMHAKENIRGMWFVCFALFASILTTLEYFLKL